MKKVLIYFLAVILVALGITSCYNQDWDFPDYKITSTYFPYQYPVRTLVLGDYYFDNTNDNNHKFLITATMGGVYANEENRLINFVVDESLADSLYLGSKQLLALPQSYYTLSNPSQIVIPKGELFGGVEVQLTEDFFNDQKSIGFEGTNYVLPLRIISATTDSVLSGLSLLSDPDVRVSGDWVTQPKNFTIFGINFVNEYHGYYLLRGRSDVMNGAKLVETNIYRNKYIERNEVVQLQTASRNEVVYKHRIENSVSSPGSFEMLISFDANGNAVITKTSSSAFDISGTAKFVKDSESWGGQTRHAIYLDYSVDDGTHINVAKDTLVFRDKGVTFQEYTPKVGKL